MGDPSRRADATLVRACLRGDPGAWEELVRRYRRLIYSIPVAYRMPASDADDVFQRVALKLLENLGKLRRVESLPAWLIVTTRRECQEHLRRASRTDPLEESATQELVEDPPDVPASIHSIECEHALNLAFEQLDPACRQLLSALYREEPAPSYRVISERLGRPIGSLGPTRNRCLQKLRRLYGRVGGPNP